MPDKREQRAWQVRVLSAAVAGIGIAATLAFWHPGGAGGDPGGDPGGVRQQMLRSISAVLPGDAKVLMHAAGGPRWDSCDGRTDTQGWSDASDNYEFTSASYPATVVAGAEATMKIAGWKLIRTSTTPLGPLLVWNKVASGNVGAQAQLSVSTRGPSRNSPSYWDLMGSAAPAGPRASGC